MNSKEPSAALRTIMRMAEEAKVDCPSDPESPDAIRNGRFASIALVAAQGLGIVNGPPLEKEPSAEAVAYSITLEGKHVGNIHERKERADFERCALENLYPHHKRTVVALYPPEALQAAEERARKAESDALELSSKVENLNSKWGELKGIIERAKVNTTTLRGFADELLKQSAQDRQDAELYRELIMAVGKKFPGESRHQTALRYIRQAEEPCGGTGNSVCAIRAEGKPI